MAYVLRAEVAASQIKVMAAGVADRVGAVAGAGAGAGGGTLQCSPSRSADGGPSSVCSATASTHRGSCRHRAYVVFPVAAADGLTAVSVERQFTLLSRRVERWSRGHLSPSYAIQHFDQLLRLPATTR